MHEWPDGRSVPRSTFRGVTVYDEKRCVECTASLLCETGTELMVGECSLCRIPLEVSAWSRERESVPVRYGSQNIEDYPLEVLRNIVRCGTETFNHGCCRVYMVPAQHCAKCVKETRKRSNNEHQKG